MHGHTKDKKSIQSSSVMLNTVYYKGEKFRPIFRAIIRPVFQNPCKKMYKLFIKPSVREREDSFFTLKYKTSQKCVWLLEIM